MYDSSNRRPVLLFLSIDQRRKSYPQKVRNLCWLIKCRGLIIYWHSSCCPDVPFGESFHNEETWVIATTSDETPRLVLRAVNLLIFTKYTYFSGQITSRSTEEMKSYFAKWQKTCHERGLFTEPARKAIVVLDQKTPQELAQERLNKPSISISPVKENHYKRAPNMSFIKPRNIAKQDSVIYEETPTRTQEPPSNQLKDIKVD